MIIANNITKHIYFKIFFIISCSVIFLFSGIGVQSYNAQTVDDVFSVAQPSQLVEESGTCQAGQQSFKDSSGATACCTPKADILAFCKEDFGDSSITSCEITKPLYLDEDFIDECTYGVRYTNPSATKDGFVDYDPDYPKVEKCTGVTGEYCTIVYGADLRGCIPYKGYYLTDSLQSQYCCKSKTNSTGAPTTQSDPYKCSEIATPPACQTDEVLAQGSSTLCCKKLTAGDLANRCNSSFPNETNPTCTDMGNYQDASGYFVSGCKVDIKNSKTGEIKSVSNINTAPVDPDSDPDNPGGGTSSSSSSSAGNGGSTDPAIQTCEDKSKNADGTTSPTLLAECVCKQYSATVPSTQRDAEYDNCLTCYSANDTDRPIYQWTSLGCVNVSVQGLIVNILRIFYGVGTGLLVFRIVVAGLKLLSNPDVPGINKDSREEIVASIVAFLFGVLSVVILRFFGINVLGLTWLEGLFPTVGA